MLLDFVFSHFSESRASIKEFGFIKKYFKQNSLSLKVTPI